jgi:predicted acetyltransferase
MGVIERDLLGLVVNLASNLSRRIIEVGVASFFVVARFKS